MKHQYDYTVGFTDLASCQAVCNDLWNGRDGCLAIDWHETDRHCVVYTGTSLAVAEWRAAQHHVETYFSCMLVPDHQQRPSSTVEVRRRLRAAGEPVPQHCGGQGEAKKCFGDGASVDSKQRNRIELLSRLTRTPEPDLATMDWNGANSWILARWREWMGPQDGPVH